MVSGGVKHVLLQVTTRGQPRPHSRGFQQEVAEDPGLRTENLVGGGKRAAELDNCQSQGRKGYFHPCISQPEFLFFAGGGARCQDFL